MRPTSGIESKSSGAKTTYSSAEAATKATSHGSFDAGIITIQTAAVSVPPATSHRNTPATGNGAAFAAGKDDVVLHSNNSIPPHPVETVADLVEKEKANGIVTPYRLGQLARGRIKFTDLAAFAKANGIESLRGLGAFAGGYGITHDTADLDVRASKFGIKSPEDFAEFAIGMEIQINDLEDLILFVKNAKIDDANLGRFIEKFANNYNTSPQKLLTYYIKTVNIQELSRMATLAKGIGLTKPENNKQLLAFVTAMKIEDKRDLREFAFHAGIGADHPFHLLYLTGQATKAVKPEENSAGFFSGLLKRVFS